jgi:hypothetical protein
MDGLQSTNTGPALVPTPPAPSGASVDSGATTTWASPSSPPPRRPLPRPARRGRSVSSVSPARLPRSSSRAGADQGADPGVT